MKQDGPSRRTLTSGGGCLSIFGLPFLAGGILMVLGALGFLSVKHEDGTLAAGTDLAVLFGMGLVFFCVGAALVFGRQKIVIDKAQGTIEKEFTVLFSLKKESKRLRTFKEVVIKFVRGDSDTADKYPVVLSGQDGDMSVITRMQFGQARESALELSEFLHLPLVDKTTQEARVFLADKTAEMTAEESAEVAVVQRPKNMRSRVNESAECLEILMPRSSGAGCAMVIMAVVAAIFGVEFFLPFSKFSDFNLSLDFKNGGDVVAVLFFGLMLFFVVIVPLTFIVRLMLQRKDHGASIKITKGAIELRDLSLFPVTKTIPLEDVIGIERSLVVESRDITHDKSVLGDAKPFDPEYAKRKQAAEKTAAVISGLGLWPGGKIIIKTKAAILETGQGLSGDELDYLCSLMAKRIAR